MISNNKLITLIISEKLAAVNKLEQEHRAALDKICDKSDIAPCYFGAKSKAPTVMLWGDSHARHLIFGLDKKFKEEDVSAIFFSRPGCAPLMDVVINNGNPQDCSQNNSLAFKYLETSPNVEAVILAAKWSSYSPDGKRLTRAMGNATGATGKGVNVFEVLGSTIKKNRRLSKKNTARNTGPKIS